MAYRTQNEKKREDLQPPQNIDAEKAVLGSILKDDQAMDVVLEVFDHDAAFYVPKHRMIFKAMLDLNKQHEPCDITTVASALADKSQLEGAQGIGGRVYLVDLAEYVASTANVQKHADIILEKFLLRRLIQTTREITRSAYDHAGTVDDILDIAEKNIFVISEQRLRKGFVSIKDLIPSTFDEIENLQSPDSGLIGVRTGYTDLDVITNGLHKGELVIVAGRPSMGKSALAMNIAEHVAIELGKGVGIFSLEMSKEQLALRTLCGRARISQQKLRAGKLRDEEWSRLTIAGGPLSEAPIYIDDSPTASSLEIRAKARRLKSQGDANLGLIIVDYLQMAYGSGRFENRQQEMASISRSLKALAKEIEVPVLACSQLSRQVEQRGGEKRPQLSDLRESGAIEQDADVVMFIYRPEHYMAHAEKTDPKFQEVEGKAEIIVAKQRNGPTGVVRLAFVKEFARFENLAPGYREVPSDVEPVGGDDMHSPF
ncbi:MAG: replicative DNA helicase [candidate division Zixibacteria bacterium]|nr:replicative DNA helicase [candidate division Zixibacteria bacterium]